MTEPWGFVPSCAGEFPNDNPALHDGVSWVCLRVSGPPRPIRRPRPTVVEAPPVVEPPQLVEPVFAEPIAAAMPTPRLEAAPEAIELAEAVAELASMEEVPGADEPRFASDDFYASMLDFVPEAAADESALESTMVDVGLSREFLTVVPTPALEALDLDLTPSQSILMAPVDEATEALDLEGVMPIETTVAASSFAFDSDDAEAAVAHESSVPEPIVVTPAAAAATPAAEAAQPAPQDGYTAFVGALVEVALAAGATRAAAVLPSLLDGKPVELSPELRDGLVAARFTDASDGAVSLSAQAIGTARAWRDVLRGESNDFSACGTSTLDGWAADLLKAFGIGKTGHTDVRRELRRRGVAAFGMLLAA